MPPRALTIDTVPRWRIGGKELRGAKRERPDNRSGPFTQAHLRTRCANTPPPYSLPNSPPVTSTGDTALRACILSQRTKVGRSGDKLAVCPRSIGQTFPDASHHCHAACSSEKRIRWHIGTSAPEKYGAKLQ